MLRSYYDTKVLSNYATKVRFNMDIHGRKKGAEENVRTDSKGTVMDPLIRRRIKDNDGSVTVIRKEVKPPKTQEKTKKSSNKSATAKTGE